MSIFDPIEQKQKPQKQKPAKSRNRRKKKDNHKEEQLQIQAKITTEANLMLPPLMIKSYKLNQEEFEEPLEEFVDGMYTHFDLQNQQHNKIIQFFQKEDDEGNIEYKLKLVNPTEDRIEHLATQMKFRIREGSGEAYYRIGVDDNGKPLGLHKEEMFESLKTICKLAHKIHVDVIVLKVSEGIKGLIAELMTRKRFRQGIKLEIRLLLFGEAGSGKSTLLGVLKSGELDNGKGYARIQIFSHPHEFKSGSTQTKSHHVIGFDSKGKLYNQQNMETLDSWFNNVNKLLSFIDVGGHKRAEKQLVSSLCSFFPEYALWVISGKNQVDNKNEWQQNLDSLELAKIFSLPLIVVITHVDKMTKEEEFESIFKTKEVLKKLYSDKTPCVIKEMEYAVLFSRITSTQDVIPIFLISSVTGKNIDLLTNFLNLLTSVSEIKNNQDMHTEFLISDKYMIDKKMILAGTVIKGSLKKGQILHLGPDQKGSFRAVEVESIECLRVPVKLAKCGQICTVSIRLMNYAKEWLANEPNAIRRGMVLVESKCNPKAAREFLAQFTNYSNTRQEIKITQKSQLVINTQTTRQICNIINLNKKQKVPHNSIQLPLAIIKKKSKSIDNLNRTKREKGKGTGRINKNSSYVGDSMKKEEEKVPPKHSMDFTEQEWAELTDTKNEPRLETIPEDSKAKKKKEVEEIPISYDKPTQLRLRFKYNPEYIQVGQKLVINELKLVGMIKEIFY